MAIQNRIVKKNKENIRLEKHVGSQTSNSESATKMRAFSKKIRKNDSNPKREILEKTEPKATLTKELAIENDDSFESILRFGDDNIVSDHKESPAILIQDSDDEEGIVKQSIFCLECGDENAKQDLISISFDFDEQNDSFDSIFSTENKDSDQPSVIAIENEISDPFSVCCVDKINIEEEKSELSANFETVQIESFCNLTEQLWRAEDKKESQQYQITNELRFLKTKGNQQHKYTRAKKR